MLLSIGMIVKNEENNLRLCLEAMRSILENTDCELIIADTGSTDSTVVIAREFTDNVFHFEWCGDFAAARNATLNRAHGEWFMAVDADEIFENTVPLTEFFNSGEFRTFNSATFIVRNYSDKELSRHTDFNAPRLVKIRKGTHYEHPVHECLTPFAEPVKILDAAADHLGYISKDNWEFHRQKCERNLELLLKQLAQNKEDYFCLYNLCQTYTAMSDYENASRCCEEGLKYAGDRLIKYSLYLYRAKLFLNLGKLAEALDTVNEYISSKSPEMGTIATDMEMYFLEADCNYRLENYHAAAVSYNKYLKLLSGYKQGSYRTSDTLQHSINFTDDASCGQALFRLADTLLKTYDYKKAVTVIASALNSLPESAEYTLTSLSKLCLMDYSADFSGILGLYKEADIRLRGLLRSFLEKALDDETKKMSVLNGFALGERDDTDYSELMRLRLGYFEGTLTNEKIEGFLVKRRTFEPYYADVVCFVLQYCESVETIASSMEASDLWPCLNSQYLHIGDLPALICGFCDRNGPFQETASVGTVLWLMELYHWGLSSLSLRPEQAKTLFLAYAETSRAYLSTIFRDECLTEENVCCIDKRLRAGFYCMLAANAFYEKRISNYLDYLDSVLIFSPDLKGGISLLYDVLVSESDGNDEKWLLFQYYAASVKADISVLIDHNEWQKAASLLKSYEEIYPDDPDIKNINALITAQKLRT